MEETRTIGDEIKAIAGIIGKNRRERERQFQELDALIARTIANIRKLETLNTLMS